MKISLIVTIKNENKTISTLLDSIAKQTRMPDEVVISVAGNFDPNQFAPYKKKIPFTIVELHESANRAVGRNRAIEKAKSECILITDAGCRLKSDWVEQMEKGFRKADVVAGFYEGEYTSILEKCEIPYVLVMPDRLDTKTFLPATRSMGITKQAWHHVGAFNEDYRFAEDYEFARRIQRMNVPITVVPEAIVYWKSRSSILSFGKMIYEHAFGDAYSRTFRPKVLTIYLRYIILVGLFMWEWQWGFLVLLLYFLFAVAKNYRYVNDPQALGYLPLLQVVSDFAVMYGTLLGWNSAR